MKHYCPCTGRKTNVCPCHDMVKEHNALKARVKAAKVIAWAAFGGLLVVAALGLTGCALKPEAHPYPNGQFQGTVDQWDMETEDQCREIAVTMVAQAYKEDGSKAGPEIINKALDNVFAQCMFQFGRSI